MSKTDEIEYMKLTDERLAEIERLFRSLDEPLNELEERIYVADLAAHLLTLSVYQWRNFHSDAKVEDLREWESGWWDGFNCAFWDGLAEVKRKYRHYGEPPRYRFIPIFLETERVILCGLGSFFSGKKISNARPRTKQSAQYRYGLQDGFNNGIAGLGKWMDSNGLSL